MTPCCRAAFGSLPTRQVVVVVWPHPPVELVTIAATLERGWSSPAVPSACPGATSGPHPTRQQRTTPGNGGHLTSQLDSPSRPASQVVRLPRFSLARKNPSRRPPRWQRQEPASTLAPGRAERLPPQPRYDGKTGSDTDLCAAPVEPSTTARRGAARRARARHWATGAWARVRNGGGGGVFGGELGVAGRRARRRPRRVRRPGGGAGRGGPGRRARS